MLAAADAFGMLAAAILLTEEPWSVGVGAQDLTPLCLVWDGWREAADRIAAHAWVAGWRGESWPARDAWMSGDSEAERLEAYTMGLAARRAWEVARAKEHEPHKFNATPIRGKLRCRCGVWAHGYRDGGRLIVKRAGEKHWPGLEVKLAQYRDESVPATLPWPQYERGFPSYSPDSTPDVVDVMDGRRKSNT